MGVLKINKDITFNGNGGELFDAYVMKAVDLADLMHDHKMVSSALHYTDTALSHQDQKYQTLHGPTGLQKVSEVSILPNKEILVGVKKGVYQELYGEKMTMSWYFSKWAKTAQSIVGASTQIQEEASKINQKAKYLLTAYDITRAELAIKVLTKGFSVTSAEGPGSPTPKGQSLFSASHTIATGGTQSNLVVGPSYTNIATGAAQLQSAIDKLRNMVDENGKKIRNNSGKYKLFCSVKRSPFWRQVINDGHEMSGQGENSNQVNIFNFSGYQIEVVELPQLGDVDTEGNIIGSDNMWFVMNPSFITFAEALRSYQLTQPELKTYENDETGQLTASIRCTIGADHYGAELGIVGCES